ncbi:hypothetical protein CONCODRAFT_68783 [Conidiobolus coronatus NRRL 28638]|uniref:Cyanovirin-N domain-containing protein n=1 Tax=Conidiobolus coronatus (strain ATCC 28846 / CBS 209.66 / NRRL 28638) TaxID=796925 RepID=A0A137PCR5_CONC2|nr:hypothetical protein CONCODRAFT_68783 [Conidiobolus coronatus NRRL 28638]|eukprot:KXN72783.1 hypothetical protein CONCODRAFT_68783 [Conidiobolus coronatus NRRL 28638]
MKRFILLISFLSYSYAWFIDFTITNSINFLNFSREFTTFIKSNAGGETSTSCSSLNNENYTCEKSHQEVSSQGGYSIYDLKCEDATCKLKIETDNVEFNIEVICYGEFDSNPNDGGFENKSESCEFRRSFQLYLNGTVEYED